MKKLGKNFDKAVEELLEEPVKKAREVFRAYDYRKLNCGGCGNQMFSDESVHEVSCLNSRCGYAGRRFKAPVVELEVL